MTGWLPPWWPNFILKVLGAEYLREDLVPEADAEDWHFLDELLRTFADRS